MLMLLLLPILGAVMVAVAVCRLVRTFTHRPRLSLALAVDAAPLAATAAMLVV